MKAIHCLCLPMLLILCMTACSNRDSVGQESKDTNPTVKQEDLLTGLVVADFWAPWCPPCRTMNPIFKKVSEELKETATFLKIDVDDHAELSRKYNIQSIPTILILKEGKVVEKKVGIVSREDLKSTIQKWAEKG